MALYIEMRVKMESNILNIKSSGLVLQYTAVRRGEVKAAACGA